MATLPEPEKASRKTKWTWVAILGVVLIAVYGYAAGVAIHAPEPKAPTAVGASLAGIGAFVAVVGQADEFKGRAGEAMRVIGSIVGFLGGFVLAALAWKDAGWVA